MEVGVLSIFQNYQGRVSDRDMVADEMRIGRQVEDLGFDKLWPAEHHFTNYSAIPDNIAYLTWLAGQTSTLKLGTGAVIVPWNDPVRVAERITLLDHLSGGRAVLGLGRGLSRTEYHHFQIDMSESRDRFDEGARMIVEALETGVIRGDGPFYPQVETPIRPAPFKSFKDRIYAVGMSPDSVQQAAKLGARLMTFSQQPWELYAEGPLAEYRKTYAKHHPGPPPPPLTGDLMFCHPDPKQAEELGIEYMSSYFLTIIEHYEILSDHFKDTKGYDHYATAADAFKAVGLELAAKTYCQVQTWGTPEMILEKLRWRKELIGDFELNLISYFGGMPVALAEQSLELFSKEVLPEVQRW